MAEDVLSVYSAPSSAYTEICNKFPFFAFTMSFYLAPIGEWVEYGISGVWALGPKLRFHLQALDSQ
jgi:hypothetical protein